MEGHEEVSAMSPGFQLRSATPKAALGPPKFGTPPNIRQYHSGPHNQVADALSRLPVPETEGGFQADENVVLHCLYI